MAVNPDIHDRAYQFFIEEVPELLQAIEDGILQLRQDRSANIVHEVMRAAHSIKGGAASVELEAIKEIAHRLETAFRALYDESVEIDMELETLLLQGYDCLQQPLNEQMETGSHNPEEALTKSMPVLQAIENKLGAEALSQADSFIPSSSDLGVDMVTSIFEIDVEQGIARLEEVASNPSAFPVAGELQTQAEVFVGFGELLELPGFATLSQAILDALAKSPNRAKEILTVALVDLKVARDAVMGGDRAQGGSPSDALLALAGTGAGASSSAGETPAIATTAAEDWNIVENLATPELLQDLSWENPESSTLDLDALAIQELLSETQGLNVSQGTESSTTESSTTESSTTEPSTTESSTLEFGTLEPSLTDVIQAESEPLAVGDHPNGTEASSFEANDFTLEQIAFPADEILSEQSLEQSSEQSSEQPSEQLSGQASEQSSEQSADAPDIFDLAATEALFAMAEPAAATANATDVSEPEPETVASFEISDAELSSAFAAESAEANASTEANAYEEETQALDPEEIKAHLLQQQIQQEIPVETAASSETTELVETVATNAPTPESPASPPAPLTDPWDLAEEATPIPEIADISTANLDSADVSLTDFNVADVNAADLNVADVNAADLNAADVSPEAAPSTPIDDTSNIDLAAVLGVSDNVAETDDIAALFGQEASPEPEIPVEAPATASELTPEPVVEAVTQPIVEPVTEPVVESVTEPVVDPMTQPVIEPVVEPVTEEVTEAASYSEAQAAEDLSNLLGAFDLPSQPDLELPVAEAPRSAVTEIIPDGTVIQEAEIPQTVEEPAAVQPRTEEITNTAVQMAMAELESEAISESISEVTPEAISESISEVTPEALSEALSEVSAEVTPEAISDAIPEISAEAIAPPTPAAPTVPTTSATPAAPAQPELPQTPQTPALDAAVQAVEDIFDQLPVATPPASAAPTPQNQVPSVAAPAAASAQAAAQNQASSPQSEAGSQKAKKAKSQRSGAALSGISVRVDLSVLERMNNLVGELTLSRNSLSMQNEQLQNVVRLQTKRFKNFEGLLGSLRSVSDEMLVKPNSAAASTSASTPSSEGESDSLLAGFDSLEMDRYNQLHMKLQEVSEELMQLEEGVDDIEVLLEQATQSISQQRQGLSRLQNELMWARMLPLDNILSRFPRVLRDLSAQHGKSVDLKLVGTSVLVDKGILEKLHDPMLHLLRNAFDHGIETPEARRIQGKEEQGTIEIRAFYQGNQTFIEIKDDGRGLKLDKIARRAVELGWLSREELRTIPQQVVADMIFEPGFSTADKVSDLSGRGVGLDVVRDQLKRLKGSVAVFSEPGEGTKFTLKLPLTLSVAKLMVCQVGPLAIALPSDAIEDLLVPDPKRIKRVAKQPFLHWRDDLIAIHPLSELLEYSCPLPDATSLKNLTDSLVPIPSEWEKPLLVFNQNDQFLAVQVDRLLMEQELVIKPFSNSANAPNYAYGCTILGDGRMIPVLDGVALVKRLTQEESAEFNGTGIQLEEDLSVSSGREVAAVPATPAPPSMSNVAPVRSAKTVLVVDDSTAMRRTLALSLEKAGYRVLQAGDGQEALEQLRQSSTIQLVICDVEMPTMNGFEFLSQRRREPQLLQIPVVMLTSRSSDKHRRLALQLNANSYFSKPYVEQEFLKAIHGILDSKTPAQV